MMMLVLITNAQIVLFIDYKEFWMTNKLWLLNLRQPQSCIEWKSTGFFPVATFINVHTGDIVFDTDVNTKAKITPVGRTKDTVIFHANLVQ